MSPKEAVNKVSSVLLVYFSALHIIGIFFSFSNINITGTVIITILCGSILWLLVYSIYCAVFDRGYDKSFFDIPGRFSPKSFFIIAAGIAIIAIANTIVSYLALCANLLFSVTLPTSQMSFPAEQLPFFLMVIYIVVIAPLFEELFFRGFVMNVLKKTGISKINCIFIVSLFFALMHGGLCDMMVAFIIGFVFGVIANTSSGLKTCIVLHMINNLVGVLQYVFPPEVNIVMHIISLIGLFCALYYFISRRNFFIALVGNKTCALHASDFASASFCFFAFYTVFYNSGIF